MSQGGDRDSLREELLALGVRPSDHFARPFRAPGYGITRTLGEGGQAVVYEAVDRRGRMVALKAERANDPCGSHDPERRRFAREIRILERLRHPHIVPVLDHGESGGRFWYAMPRIRGRSFEEFARDRGRDPAAVMRAFETACSAVAAAHRAGVVHRDLKPSNLLVRETGEAVVLDFGMAYRTRDVSSMLSQSITRAGECVGTPAWLAPEQVFDPDRVGPATDVYALGRVLYLALSGEHPYPGDPHGFAWLQHLREARPRDIARAVRIDRELREIVMSAVDHDPDRRPEDAGVLLERCREWTPRPLSRGVFGWFRTLGRGERA